jgi:hypothetical protein
MGGHPSDALIAACPSPTTVEMLDGIRAREALAEQEVKHEHEASDRAGAEGSAEADARPGDHRGRRPAGTSLRGKTPGQTFYSVLYSESKREDGLVIQVDRGTFKLNPKRRRTKAAA